MQRTSLRKGQHAIVIGASIAGLLAGRVLSDHFERVTIIDRDTLPDAANYRSGTPQARHIHALLARGQHIMEDLFPGLSDELTQLGAPVADWGHGYAYFGVGWAKHYPNGLITNTVTRLTLEWRMRQRLNQLPNVSFVTRSEVEGLLLNPAKTCVSGVQLRSRANHNSSTLNADLVIDASGRDSKAPAWLQSLGYPAPAETLINSHLGYATRWYEGRGQEVWASIAANGDAATGHTRAGGIFRVEGNRWVVTLVGVNKDYPPTNEAAFMEFARTLPTPIIHELIKTVKPISPIYGYRYGGSRRRHYEKLVRRPENFLIMGDAVCSFNPVYGQGMTIAAIEAEALGKLFLQQSASELTGVAGRFQQVIAQLSQGAWLMATGEDLRSPGTEGPRPGFVLRLSQRYTVAVLEACCYDAEVSRAFGEVWNLIKPPTALFAPNIMWRVLQAIRSDPQIKQAAKIPARDLLPDVLVHTP